MNYKNLILIAIIILFVGMMAFFSCDKEYSCENCRSDTVIAPVDTVIVTDTIVPTSNMVSNYNFYIADNQNVKVIYVEYTSKYRPQTFTIFANIKVEDWASYTYTGSINLRDYLPPDEKYKKGDVFIIRYEIRYKNGDITWVDSTILIY